MHGLTVTTFNVHLERGEDPQTVRAVGEGGADLIALQETNPVWAESLRARYQDSHPYMLFRHKGAGSGGLAVLSRYPVVDAGVREYLDWHPAWHVLVESDMGLLQVLLVHLRAPLNRKDGAGAVTAITHLDKDHLAEIRAFSAECERDLPTLVLGDFNEAPDGAAVRWLEGAGFVNVLPMFKPGVETWRRASAYGQIVETVDHILLDDAFVPLSAWVDRMGRSDHLPVTARIEAAHGSAYR